MYPQCAPALPVLKKVRCIFAETQNNCNTLALLDIIHIRQQQKP